MKNKVLLIVFAIIGTVISWTVTDNFIVAVNIGQFLLIELIITLMHELYNFAKKDIINKS
jgi:hypothetical protein